MYSCHSFPCRLVNTTIINNNDNSMGNHHQYIMHNHIIKTSDHVKIQSVSCIRDLTLYPTTTRARHRTIPRPRARSYHDDYYHLPISLTEHPSASSIDQPSDRGTIYGILSHYILLYI